MPLPERKPAVGAAVWRADEIGGKAGLSWALTGAELDALDDLVRATRDVPTLSVSANSFAHPDLQELARACAEALVRGRGAVILTGLDPARYGANGFRTVYWYLGHLLGHPAPQSERGDLLGYVRQEKDNPFGRGYISNMELNFHNDFHEILSLACVEAASVGGESGLVSSLAIHNILLEERPDLLEALYWGWYDGLEAFYRIFRPTEQLSARFTPFFCEEDGFVSLQGVNAMFSDRAAAERGEAVPEILQEALAAVRDIAGRPGLAARFILGPGEMLFWHNWTALHARSRFENLAGRERVLMRLWLYPHKNRPGTRIARERAQAVDRIHAQIGTHAPA